MHAHGSAFCPLGVAGADLRSDALPLMKSGLCVRWLSTCLLMAAAGGSGCQRAPVADVPDGAARQPRLKLLVVDDPAMAEAIERLRAEWRAQSGAALVIEQRSAEEARASAPTLECDAVIYPVEQLGELAEANAIVPLPGDYAANRELAWADTFELVQVAEVRWGQAPWAVSFGSALLTCYYRADLFEKLRKRPPQTWSEYHELAGFFAERGNLSGVELPDDWAGAIEPLAPAWAGRALLARAAGYAKHRDHFSTLFKIDTMEPLVAGAPFVRALEELVADAKFGTADGARLDPIATGQRFLQGKAALALATVGHAATQSSHGGDRAVAVAFVELPGSPKVYDIASAAWENRKSDESARIPLLGFSGRLGSIAAQSAEPAAAFQLLAWLSGREWGTTVGSASRATSLYRRSQLAAPQPWVDPQLDAAGARQFAGVQRDALSRQAYLHVPRLPGEEKYLAALDAAVAQALVREKPPADALAAAADAWRTITAELGLESQRAAYRKSLGLDP
jgi:multiple sugar transport system substrate-binding protein